jgi:putative DNA methylase
MTYKKKLIEVALPLAKINFESARQKTMGASPHYQNLHRWWARRPAAAARAILWASLVDDPSGHPELFPSEIDQAQERRRLFDLLERLIPWDANDDEIVFKEAFDEIRKSCIGELPTILDPFGGGGAIPLEAMRLGLPTCSGDLNPVAVLIQKVMLEIPSLFNGVVPVYPGVADKRMVWNGIEGLSADVEAYGKWMQERVFQKIGHLYQIDGEDEESMINPIAFIWARTVKSTDPSWPGSVPLVRSWVLAKRPGKDVVWVEPIVNHELKEIRYEVREGGSPPEGNVNRNGATCIATGASMPFSYIRDEASSGRMSESLIAIVAEDKSGRIYLSPQNEDLAKVDALDSPIEGKIFDWPGRMNVVRYGIDEFSKLFTRRQSLALNTFSEVLSEVFEKIVEDNPSQVFDKSPLRDGGRGATAYGQAIVTCLAMVISKSSEYWSSICTWNSSTVQVRNTFAKQAIPMTWDFCEANPFSDRMASWDSMLKGVVRSLLTLPIGKESGATKQMDARARLEDVGNCVLSTDPPYYDNICYADLSDYFYIWLRKSLKSIWADEFSTLLTPKIEELIANRYRAGSKEAANLHFEYGMEGVFSAAAANADERYPATIFYAFKASESEDKGNISTGWETFLSGLLNAGFAVTATWPVRTELANKIGVNAGDNMLASSIVLACRKRSITAAMATRGEFIAALRSEMAPAVKILQVENIAPVDMAQSAIGPGIGIFSRYSKVVEADGQPMTVRTALSLINEVLAEVLSGEESEFDADTRFAVTWFEQFGHNPGAFGDADTLAKAKNTTVGGVVESGVAASKDGKLRLLERKELSDKWDPKNDSRLTVWETTQHLIRALEISESKASELLKQIGGGFGEKARQLAYLLYGICDRKKWASEGSAYNMLVTAWPEIEKLAHQEPNGDSSPETLF